MASSSGTSKPEDQAPAAAAAEQTSEPAPKSLTLGEDDEFEDFPVDDWGVDETEAAGDGASKHLWDESWDDDDTSDDFSAQLKEELKKVEAAKRR